jgi:sec-independent protein translocase protein TatC
MTSQTANNPIVSSHNHCSNSTGLTEVFLTYLRVSMLGAFNTSLSVFFSQFWFFLAPGLYRQGRKIFIIFFMTAIFFVS